MTKNSESDYFCFPPPKSEYFFQQHWESEYFFGKKKHNPPPPPFKLNGRSLIYLFFLVWLENFIFFDFLVRQVLLLLIMLVPILSIQYYFLIFFFFLPAASFLNAALCWSICVWILNKSPKRHLPRGFLFRSIHSPPCYACMS